MPDGTVGTVALVESLDPEYPPAREAVTGPLTNLTMAIGREGYQGVVTADGRVF